MKWVFRLLGLVLVVVLLLVAAVFLVPADRLARIATDQLAAATGRDVVVRGDVSLTLWPVLGVSAEGIEISNADWSAQGPMFEAAKAAIGVDALGLLRGEVAITGIEARSPTIRLDQRADGRANWHMTQSTPGAGGTGQTTNDRDESTARKISIAAVRVTDATLIYDAEGNDQVALSGVEVSLDWPDPDGPADFTMVMQPAQTPVTVALVVETFGPFIAGQVSALQARVETAAGSLDLDGRASTDGAVAGTLTFSTDKTDDFLAAFGLPALDLPAKMGRQIDARTDVTLTPDLQLALRQLRVDLGGNVVTGAADIGLSGVPQVNAKLDAGALDLDIASDDTPQSGSGGGGARQTNDGWSKTAIDASALAAFNGDISLTADSIDLGGFDLGKTAMVLRNDQARAVFELTDVSAYGGRVTGEFVVNNRAGLSVGGQMQAQAIQMQPLLRDAADIDRLKGQGTVQLSFLGSGPSVDAIMKSLSGTGSLDIGKGTIEGINLDQLLRGGAASGTTIFDDLTASWTIADGVLSNQDLLLQLKNYRVSGAGVVGLGRQTVDYRITPVALRANSGNGIAIPVVFKGPWSDISIRPDVEAVLDQQLDEERKKLEARAKEKLNETLGVSGSTAKSTEEAIKDKLEDTLRGKLFD